MTSNVLPPFSSKVTVVTGPPSPPSSLVQARRECGVTSIYRPKNSSGFEASWPNTKRYLPPTRTSISQERKNMPIDFGTHHRLNRTALVHASNTMCAGALNVRVTTISRSDVRSTVVRLFMGVGSLSLASIDLLLPFQFLDNLVQLVEACVPELAIPLDPAVSSSNRRGPILLAEKFRMTLTGMKKHVGVLEQAGLVTTEKVGRVRTCGRQHSRSRVPPSAAAAVRPTRSPAWRSHAPHIPPTRCRRPRDSAIH